MGQKTFSKSTEFLKRASEVIPLGSQTFSKSKVHFPVGASPLFMTRAKGSKTWDLDGNEFLDFASALGAITLGHQDPDVNAAVIEQLAQGTILSLPHPIETEVAELMRDMVPCAQMVRFGKNGSDATTGAVRLARAFTKKDRIAICGYHGWHDWYIGTTPRSMGVPAAVSGLSHTFQYNSIESLNSLFKQHPGEFAAVILEPLSVTQPEPGFLNELKELTHKNGALLIFDEVVSGFRVAKGGAQAHLGVMPDLAAFGKGLANGFPLSALAGRADVMKLLEEVFFSFTYGGDALALAAAKATLTKLKNQPVIETIASRGQLLQKLLKQTISTMEISGCIDTVGYPAMQFLSFKDTPKYTLWQIKTLFLQEMCQRGILTLGSMALTYAHSEDDVRAFSTAFEESVQIIADGLREGRLEKLLKCDPLVPLFRVR